MENYLTIKEAAEIIGMTTAGVRAAIREGRIEATCLRGPMLKRSDVEQFRKFSHRVTQKQSDANAENLKSARSTPWTEERKKARSELMKKRWEERKNKQTNE